MLGSEMKKAVTRLRQAFERQEKIVIFGDYDVDGTSGVISDAGSVPAVGPPLWIFVGSDAIGPLHRRLRTEYEKSRPFDCHAAQSGRHRGLRRVKRRGDCPA